MAELPSHGATPALEIADAIDTWSEDATSVMSAIRVAELREAMLDGEVDSRTTIRMSEGEVMRLRLACMGARD